MKRLSLLLLLLCCIASCLQAQHRLAAPTRAALARIADDRMVQAFITYDQPSCLDGLQVNMRYDDVALVTLSASQFTMVSQRPGVHYLALAEQVYLQTDSSRSATLTNQVQQGVGLDMPYDGSGVVVGVIDTGIDFNHLAFRDSEGRRRIERVYCPTVTTGHPVVIDGDTLPGSQYVTEDEIMALTTDDSSMTHGTHTLGIAAGTHVGSYGGMAPGARLVAVAIPNNLLTNARLLMGARYIADVARQLGCPCVINISMGDHIGPHDGTSVSARGFDAICDNGAIIVQSAGNEGSRPLHLHKDFNPDNSISGSWVGTVMRTSSNKAKAEVDAWSADATPFSLELQLYDTRYGDTRFVIPPISHDTIICLDDHPEITQYATGTIQIRCGVDPVNGRYRIYSTFDTKMTEGRDFWAHIYRCDTVASIDVWNGDNRSRFEQMGRYDWQAGDSEYSINDMATGHNTISVANYSARSYYPSPNGTLMPSGTEYGNISVSSSYGMLPDGRSLPLVAAPGVAVISSVSRYNGQSSVCFQTQDNDGVTYGWGNLSGTSMSSPCVAGIVALWLQACPTLTPQQVQDIIAKTSVNDDITAQEPIRWGAGKINAWEGLKMALSMRQPALRGDVNNDGRVDIADVNTVINVMLGKSIDTVQPMSCDVNGDGKVDISDVNAVINIMLGKS